MRLEIDLTDIERRKLNLLLAQGELSRNMLALSVLRKYLAGYEIVVCAADRCAKQFAVSKHGAGQRKRYCSNACRVYQSRHTVTIESREDPHK